MAKKEDQDAPVDSTAAEPTTPLATEGAATTPTTTTIGRLGKFALVGIIGGSVVAAALLFGGGVAVGIALPDRAPIGIVQAGQPGGHPGMEEGFPGAQQDMRGDGVRPDGQDRKSDSDTESDSDSESDTDRSSETDTDSE